MTAWYMEDIFILHVMLESCYGIVHSHSVTNLSQIHHLHQFITFFQVFWNYGKKDMRSSLLHTLQVSECLLIFYDS